MNNVLQVLTGHGAPTGRLVRMWLIAWLGMTWMLIHIYSGFYGSPNAILYRTLHVGLALALVFLYMPTGSGRWRDRQPLPLVLFDAVLVIASLSISAYFMLFLDSWEMRRAAMGPFDFWFGVMAILLVLEATRRSVGIILVIVCAFFMLHALFANYFPPPFFGPPNTPMRLVRTIFLGDDGLFGVAVSVMAQFVVLFILFGAMLNITGAGAFFTRIAFALFGHRIGGPAKAAVVSSAMMGTLSGSAIGNVVTTGSFTIPLMKRLGYKPAFAGGVEAAASNGGVIMPPVMGAVAFIMAEFLNRSYAEIIVAAAIPGILYFLVIYITVHFEAKKLGLRAMAKDALPNAWMIFKARGYLLLPLVLIITALVYGYSIIFVAVIVITATFILALIQRTNRMTPLRLFDSMEQAVRGTVGLSATAAAAGIIIGSIFATGLSFTVAQFAIQQADGQIWIVLVIAAVMALIMGMGMTAAAVYITLAATVIPILIKAGIDPLAAHMFAFYFGNASNITPPVALAAYAAAPIAKASPMAVGVQASRLGAGTFFLPFLFVYGPALLFEGEWYETIQVTFTAGLGLTSMALALTGYFFTTLPPWQRLIFLGSALFLIVPELLTDAIGVGLFLVGAFANWQQSRRAPAPIVAVAVVDQESTAPIEPQTGLGRLWNRFVSARMEKEEIGGVTTATEAESLENITEALMREPEVPGGSSEVTPKALWMAWGVVIIAAGAMEFLGQIIFHARNPIWWVAAIAAIALFAVVGVSRVWAAGRIREERPAPPGIPVNVEA